MQRITLQTHGRWLFALLGALASTPAFAAELPKRPNIIVIITDDMDSINVSQREKPSLLTRIGMFWRK